MSEKEIHPQEPAEGAEEDVAPPGAGKAGQDRENAEGAGAQDRSRAHPQEPAEGGDDEAGAPGADKPGDNG